MSGGTLDRETIRASIREQQVAVRFCYEQGLSRRPGLEGRVVIQLTVEADGSVTESGVVGSTLGDAAVELCVARALERVRCPSSTGRGPVVVTYPFMFMPGDDPGAHSR